MDCKMCEKVRNTCGSKKRQPHKMVKQTQTVRRLLPTNCLSVFDHFVGLALKGLKSLTSTGISHSFMHILQSIT